MDDLDMAVTFDQIRKVAMALDGVVETTSYGTPAFKVNGKLFARLHQDKQTLILAMNFDQREDMISMDPDTFFITDHYKDYEWVLVHLAQVSPTAMRKLLEISHQTKSIRKGKQSTSKKKSPVNPKKIAHEQGQNDDKPGRKR
jgi:hypothetical protein